MQPIHRPDDRLILPRSITRRRVIATALALLAVLAATSRAALPVPTQTFTDTQGTALTTHEPSFTLITGGFEIFQNGCRSDTFDAVNAAYWAADVFDNDQYSQADATSFAFANGLGVRMSGTSSADYAGYVVRWHITSAVARVIKHNGDGTSTNLGDPLSNPTAGQVVKITVETSGTDAVIKVYYDDVLQGTPITDSTSPIASGSAGIDFAATNASTYIDNWTAGNLAAAPSGLLLRRRRD